MGSRNKFISVLEFLVPNAYYQISILSCRKARQAQKWVQTPDLSRGKIKILD